MATKASKRKETSKSPTTRPKRNLEDLWKAVFPVGTEWDQFELLYKFDWKFSNLDNELEEGGKLHGEKFYLFGCSEQELVAVNGEDKFICIPVVVAVVLPFPPSDKIGITSVQREVEEIIPMKKMKMDWVPYFPLENRESRVDRLKSQIFILSCSQRRVALNQLKIDQVKKFEYCLPYFYHPLNEELEEMSEETKVALERMKFYKFYPAQTPDAPDISSVKSPFINRYYGKAHEIL